MTNQMNRAMELYNEYVDCTQHLPLDIQQQITQMQKLNLEYHQMMTKLNKLTESFKGNVSSEILAKLSKLLEHGSDIGHRKVLTMQKTSDLVEDKLMRLDNCNKEYLNSIKKLEVPMLHTKERCLPSASTSTATKELKNRSTDNETNNGIQISKQLQRNRADKPDYKVMPDDKVLISSLNRPTPLPRATATAKIKPLASFKQTTQKKEKPTNKMRKYKKKQKDNTTSTDDDEEIFVDLKKSTKKKRKYKKQQNYNSSSTEDYEELFFDPEKHSKKKRKYKKQQNHNSPSTDDDEEIPVDPDEPTYCLCDQISYGKMICCDNDLCPLEWFHFSCVSLSTKPKGKWFCPKCRGDRYNIMKPKAEFLKELERYNKEKEDQA